MYHYVSFCAENATISHGCGESSPLLVLPLAFTKFEGKCHGLFFMLPKKNPSGKGSTIGETCKGCCTGFDTALPDAGLFTLPKADQ